MKRALMCMALLGAIVLAGCGGNGDTTSQSHYNNGTGDQPFKPTTHLSHRSLVTNYFTGVTQVFDTVENRLTNYTFSTGTQPTYMQSSPDGTLTFINNSGANTISSLNNNQESVKATIQLGGWTESFVTSTNNKFGFAAVYNYANGTFRTPGAIVRFNPTDGSENTQIQFPYVRYIAMDTSEKHLLAFTDMDDNAHWVDLTTEDPTTQVPPVTVIDSIPAGTLSHPVAAFFSGDSTNGSGVYTAKAYVLNCGTECGGSSAPSVVELDITESQTVSGSVTTSTITATVGNKWAVPGARRGLFDSSANKLYVTGSSTTKASGVMDGYFSAIDLSAGTVKSFQIGDGEKRVIRNIKGTFWVGGVNCGTQSCISLVNPTAGTFTQLATPRGDATGISLTGNRGQVYTVEGGEVYIYDQKGVPVYTEYATDVKGQAVDVIYIN